MKTKIISFRIYAFMLLCFFVVISCTKKPNNHEKSKDEAKLKITIENNGDIEHYGAGLTASSSLTKDLKMVNIVGVEWSEKETANNVTIYSKDYERLPKTISFETDGVGTWIQFGYVAFINDNSDNVVNKLKATVKYYIDGKLVKTDLYNPLDNGGNTKGYIANFDVGDY